MSATAHDDTASTGILDEAYERLHRTGPSSAATSTVTTA